MNPALRQRFPGLRLGLIGGACLVLLSLIGMVETFNQREIISDVISMGQTLLLLTAMSIAYLAAKRAGAWAGLGFRSRHHGRPGHGGHAGLAGDARPCHQHAAGVHQCLTGAFFRS